MFQRIHTTLGHGLRLACAAGALAAWALLAPTGAHATDTAAVATPQRFATDTAVREGMAAIRLKMAAQEAGVAKDQLRVQDYAALANALEADMQTHLVRRSLPKAAALAFNGSVWQDLSYCVGLMRNGRSLAVQRSGALGVQQVLRNYPQYFEHPGW